MAAVDRIRRHEADIMPVVGIVRARIAKASEDEHGNSLRARRGLFLAV